MDLATEFANTSSIFEESLNSKSKALTVDINSSVVLSKSSPTPADNLTALGIASMISFAYNPAEAMLYIEFAILSNFIGTSVPICIIADCKFLTSSCEAPATAPVIAIDFSI